MRERQTLTTTEKAEKGNEKPRGETRKKRRRSKKKEGERWEGRRKVMM